MSAWAWAWDEFWTVLQPLILDLRIKTFFFHVATIVLVYEAWGHSSFYFVRDVYCLNTRWKGNRLLYTNWYSQLSRCLVSGRPQSVPLHAGSSVTCGIIIPFASLIEIDCWTLLRMEFATCQVWIVFNRRTAHHILIYVFISLHMLQLRTT
jgi:hypothetical protein